MLGQGGFGAVLAARDRQLERDVALKLVLDVDPDGAARLVREGKLLARLSHAAVLRVFDSLLIDGVPVLVLELVAGRTLAALLQETPQLPPHRVTQLAHELLEALAAGHAAGIVHRDIKPENVMLLPDGGLKLLDFGIARPVDAAAITAHGVVCGTPEFMAPEQCRGEPPEPRTDLYAVGVLMHLMLSGKAPFKRSTPIETVMAHLEEQAPDLDRAMPALPRALTALIRRALAKEPADRPASAAAMVAELEALRPHGGETVDLRATAPPGQLRRGAASGRTQALSATSVTRAATVASADREPGPRGVARALPFAALALGGLAIAAALVPRGPTGAPATPSPSSIVRESASAPDAVASEAEPGPRASCVLPVGGGQSLIVPGREKSQVRVRTVERAPLFVYGADARDLLPTASRAGDFAAEVAGPWQRLGAGPCDISHRIDVIWTGAREARVLKVTAVDDAAAAPLCLLYDRRSTQEQVRLLMGTTLQAYQRNEDVYKNIGLQGAGICDGETDLDWTFDTQNYTLRHDAIGQLVIWTSAAAGHELAKQFLIRAKTGPTALEFGQFQEALVTAAPADAEAIWRHLCGTSGAWTLAALLARDERLAAEVAREPVPGGQERLVRGLALWHCGLPDRDALMRDWLSRLGGQFDALAEELLRCADPGIGPFLVDLANRDEKWAHALETGAAIRSAANRRDVPLVAWLLGRLGRNPSCDQAILAAAAETPFDAAGEAAIRRWAAADPARTDAAALALVRAGRPIPERPAAAPLTLRSPVAYAFGREPADLALLERWACDGGLDPAIRASACFALALRDRDGWARRATKIRETSNFRAIASALRDLDAWGGKHREYGDVSWGPCPAADVAARRRALVVLVADPWGAEVPVGLRVRTADRVRVTECWSWMPGRTTPPELELRWTGYQDESLRRAAAAELRADVSWQAWPEGEAIVGFPRSTPPPDRPTGLMWLVLRRDLAGH